MLTSRPVVSTIDDVRNLVASNSAEIRIIDNTIVDPPLFSLTLDLADGKQIPLLVQRTDQKITLFDMIAVLQELGFAISYQEIR